MNGCVQLPSGHAYRPMEPLMRIPEPWEIAHKLAQTIRFGGSCKFPYSVGQHSILGAKAILRDGYPSSVALAFLFHDAAEPFGVCDLASPIKHTKPDSWFDYITTPRYWMLRIFVKLHKCFEDSILQSLLDHYGIAQDKATQAIVKEYDTRIISDEKTQVMSEPKFDWGKLPEPLDIEIKEMDWKDVRDEWLRMYNLLVWE